MVLTLLLVILSLSVLAAAAIFDWRTREVPDTLSIGFIIAALGIQLLYGLYETFLPFFYGLAGLGLTFLLGYLLYNMKQVGGGDVKLFMGLGAAFGSYSITWPQNLLLYIILATIGIGGLYTFSWGLTIFYRKRNTALPLWKEKVRKKRTLRLAILILGVAFIAIAFLVNDITLGITLATAALSLILLFHLSIFIRVVEKVGFLKHYPLEKVTEGDWLAKDVKVNGKVLVSAKEACLEKNDLRKIKKYNIKKVWIKVGVPFVPAMFVATALALAVYFL